MSYHKQIALDADVPPVNRSFGTWTPPELTEAQIAFLRPHYPWMSDDVIREYASEQGQIWWRGLVEHVNMALAE